MVVLAATFVVHPSPASAAPAVPHTYFASAIDSGDAHAKRAVDNGLKAFGHVCAGSVSPAVRTEGTSTTSPHSFMATDTVDDVIAETMNATTRNLTSAHTLTADEAIEAGQQWVGDSYTELGKPGSGVYRSADSACVP